MFFLLLGIGIEISTASRALTTFREGEYVNPNSLADTGYTSLEGNGGGYSPRDYGYEKNKNDYYPSWGRFGKGSIGSSYGVPEDHTEKGKVGGYVYGEQYGQNYGSGGEQHGESSKEYHSYSSDFKDGGVYKYHSYRNRGKDGEPSEEYGGNQNSGEDGAYKYPNYGNDNKGGE